MVPLQQKILSLFESFTVSTGITRAELKEIKIYTARETRIFSVLARETWRVSYIEIGETINRSRTFVCDSCSTRMKSSEKRLHDLIRAEYDRLISDLNKFLEAGENMEKYGYLYSHDKSYITIRYKRASLVIPTASL